MNCHCILLQECTQIKEVPGPSSWIPIYIQWPGKVHTLHITLYYLWHLCHVWVVHRNEPITIHNLKQVSEWQLYSLQIRCNLQYCNSSSCYKEEQLQESSVRLTRLSDSLPQRTRTVQVNYRREVSHTHHAWWEDPWWNGWRATGRWDAAR